MIDMFVKAQKVFSGPAKVLGMCKESVCGVDDLHMNLVGSKAMALFAIIIALVIYNNNN